ncbi:hypothetical protein [Trichococcus paludicola]|uniref:hypothetical protein n=1 Tax=Trichococcus paludicola TaxID=2052942 RepID=UPI000D34DF9B|nr:hypothetical protein [Trichococcus paludicola]
MLATPAFYLLILMFAMGVFSGLMIASNASLIGQSMFGFSSAAFVAPKVTASLAAANNGDFTKAFYVAIAVVLLGLGLSLVYALRKSATKLATETVR